MNARLLSRLITLAGLSLVAAGLLLAPAAEARRKSKRSKKRGFRKVEAVETDRGTGLAPAEPRRALVIGNAKYKVGRLKNPVRDAKLIARSLRDAGFLHRGAGRRAFPDAPGPRQRTGAGPHAAAGSEFVS